MGFLRKNKKHIAIVLLPVLVILYVNSVINRHEHLVSGYTYTHSHPFDRSESEGPFQPHHHSDRELLFLDQISIPVMVLIAVLVVPARVIRFFEYVVRVNQATIEEVTNLHFDPRAPPLLHII